jgi:hypothetical protein
MGVVLLTALGLATLRNPTPLCASAVFTLAVGVLCVAILAALVHSGEWRPFWTGFALLGWIHLVLAFQFTTAFTTANNDVSVSVPPLLTVHGLALMYDQLEPPGVGLTYYARATLYAPTVLGPAGSPSAGAITTPTPRWPLGFYQVGQSLASLFVALIGGLSAKLLARRVERARGTSGGST